MKKCFWVWFFLTALLFGQSNTTIPGGGVRSVAALPSVCGVLGPDYLVWLNTGTVGLYMCLSANTYTQAGAGSAGTVTSVGLVGTANQITVTGASPITGSGSWTLTLPSVLTLPGTINKLTLTAPATGATLTLADGKTVTINSTLTLVGTDSTTLTFQGTDTYVGRGTTDTLTNKTLTAPTIASFTNATHTHTNAAGGGTLAEAALALTNITTNDATTTAHGFAPKGTTGTTQYWRQDWTLGTPTGGSASSVFTGSTATAPAFSATPTFSLADVSSTSPVRVEPGALTANVTAVTFTNKTAGAKFSIAWTQDGTGGRTIAYGASATNACVIDPTASATTTQFFEVGSDGTTVNGVGCKSTTSIIAAGPEMAAPGTPAASTGVAWFDSTNHILSVKQNNSATVSNTVVPDTGASNNFLTAISAGGVISKAQPAFTNISGTATVGQGGTGATTFTAHGPLVGETTSAIVATSPGTTGQCYLSNGASSDPSFQACPGGAGAGNSVTSTTPVTVNTNTTSDQQLIELSLGAGYFNSANQPFLFDGAGVYTTQTAQTPTITLKVKLCTVSGCGSGTVVTLISIVSTATVAAVTNNNWNLAILGYTHTTGATGNLEIHGPLAVDLGALTTTADSIFVDTNTAVSSNIDLTAALFVDFTIAFSTNAATANIFTQRSGGVMPFAATAAPVTSFTGDGSLISNSASTGVVTATLATAAAHKAWMNNTGSTAAPGYQSIGTADLPAALANQTSINGLAITASTGTLTVTNAKTLAVSNTLTLAGTDSTTMTFPAASATITQTIASGTSALGTSAIAANVCATVVTTTATGTASTDAIGWSPNADISGVTGYGVASTDGLKVYPYPTTNNVNWRVCNGTGTSITPGAVTLNWRVTR